MIQNKTVLVTGGAGFIGSTLSNRLADENEVIVVDNFDLGIEENLDRGIDVHETDIRAPDLPTEVDVVFHLASKLSHLDNRKQLVAGTRVNVEGFVNVVEQAREDGCETVVYASTGSLYEERPDPSPTAGTVTVDTGYEASKLARERYAEYFGNHYGMNMAGMRLLPTYQTYRSDKKPYANRIAQFIDDVAHGRSPVIYGNGESKRDFTHIDDIVRGLIVAADNQLTGVYNLGTGRAVSFNELVEMIAETLDTEVQPTYIESPVRTGISGRGTVVGCEKLRAETGWEPEVSIEDGVERICSQYRALEQ